MSALVARSGRPWAIGIAVAAAAVVAAFAVLTHDKQGSAPDTRITMWVFWHARPHWEARALLELSEPAFDVGVLAAIAVGAAYRKAWRVAALTVVGPVIALLLSEQVLKPVVHRTIRHGIAFPSGHETGIASVATVVGLLLLRTAAPRLVKVIGVFALFAWSVLAAVGLVRDFVHYPSDTLGGFCVAVAVVLVTALVIDAVADRRSRPPVGRNPDADVSGPAAPDRPRTARAT